MLIAWLLLPIMNFADWLFRVSVPDELFQLQSFITQGQTALLLYLPAHPLIPYYHMGLALMCIALTLVGTILYSLVRVVVHFVFGR